MLYTYPNQLPKQKTKSECYTKLNLIQGDWFQLLFLTHQYIPMIISTHLQKSYITKDLDDKAST